MQNQDPRIVRDLEREMRAASAVQDYETAARKRDQLQAATAFFEKSAVVLGDRVDLDVFGIEHDELAAAVHLFMVRGGRIRGERSWTVDKELDVPLGELVGFVVENAYGDGQTPAREVVVPELPDDAEALEAWLGGLAGRNVSLRVAQRGAKAQLLATATQNAKQSLMLYKTRRSADFTTRSQALEDIQEALGMADAPLRIECFDVSHLSGTNIVASMVVFEDGLPRKDEYRRFTIPNSTDDTDSIHQVLTRRLAYLGEPVANGDGLNGDGETTTDGAAAPQRRAKFAYRPTSSSSTAASRRSPPPSGRLRESGVEGVYLCGIAKRLEEIWTPGVRLPGDPAAQQRRALPLPAHPRRGAPVRDHAPAPAAQARHRHGPVRGPGARPGAREGAAQALRLGRAPPRRRRGRDRRGAGHRTRARGERPSRTCREGPDRAATRLGGRGSCRKGAPTPWATATVRRCSSSPGCRVPGGPRWPTRSRTSAGTSSTTCRRRCSARWSTSRSAPAVAAAHRGRRRHPRRRLLLRTARHRPGAAQRRRRRSCSSTPTMRCSCAASSPVRRPHPLQGDGTLLDGIAAERARLAEVREASDIIVDTSDLNIHQLATLVTDTFAEAGRAGRPGRRC